MKFVTSGWPPDFPGRALVAAFLGLPILFAILTAFGWQNSVPVRVPSFVVGGWLIVLAALLAVPSPARISPPRLVSLGMVLAGAGWIVIGIASTRSDLASFILLELGGIVLSVIGLILVGSTVLGALSGTRS